MAGGKTLLENYQASADSQILLRIENEDQIDGFYDPVLLATVSTTNLPTMPSATFTGITKESDGSFSDKSVIIVLQNIHSKSQTVRETSMQTFRKWSQFSIPFLKRNQKCSSPSIICWSHKFKSNR